MTVSRRFSLGLGHSTYAAVFGVVSLGLILNALLVVAWLPFVALLMTTDPARSWPLLALAAPLCAPALTAAAWTFRVHGTTVSGAAEGGVVRTFLAGYRATWRRALALGALITAFVTVALVDIRMLAETPAAVYVVPLLLVATVLACGVAVVAAVAIAEAPEARLRDILRASLFLAVTRGHLTIVSLVVLAAQAVLFTAMPALALGLTASASLYLVWANGRFTLRPVLSTADSDDVTHSQAAPAGVR
jgi:uncharacterized membrane protein YesL